MFAIALQPVAGTYRAPPEFSSFAFAVRHSGVFGSAARCQTSRQRCAATAPVWSLTGLQSPSPSPWSSRP
jgi:hypothetical protein